ncbi:ABC transporter substrate-binding protein [Caproicibacter sp.]|uniref:ABC transporter substrate-binding protein n=1 Tax=Caproicibacter sp. TaxID=2814884 RepID=UPI003989D8B6
MKFVKKIALLLAAATILSSLAACGGSSTTANGSAGGTSSAASKKTINVGLTNTPANLDPLDFVDNATTWITQILYLPLMDLGDDGTYKPQLADSVETTDNKIYTVHLNKDAKWTDGQPVTADDVVFTTNLVCNPKTNSNLSSYINLIDGTDKTGKSTGDTVSGVKKIDDHTVQFTLKSKAGMDVFKDSVCKNIKTVPQHVFKDADPATVLMSKQVQDAAVTDGAFKLVSFQKSQYVQLAANKDYFRGTPKVDELNFKIMQGSNITAELQSGEIDMNWPGIGNVPVEDYDKVKAMENLTIIPGVPWTIQYLFINNKTFNDKKVRQAISMAIDRKSINDNLCKGEGELIQLPFASDYKFLNKDVSTPAFDLAKAKQLLAESGFDTGKTIRFNVPTGNTTRESVANVVQSNLTALGLNVQIQKYDFPTIMSKLRSLDYDLTIVGNSTTPTNPTSWLQFLYETGMDHNGYSNPDVDSLIESAYVETDENKIKEDYMKLQEILADEMPTPGLYASYELMAVNKRIVTGKPKIYGMTVNVQDWDIK